MSYKLEMRWDRHGEWFETIAGDGSELSRWRCPDAAYEAYVATVKRWPSLSHRMLKCDTSGEPLAVVAISDMGILEELGDTEVFPESEDDV